MIAPALLYLAPELLDGPKFGGFNAKVLQLGRCLSSPLCERPRRDSLDDHSFHFVGRAVSDLRGIWPGAAQSGVPGRSDKLRQSGV